MSLLIRPGRVLVGEAIVDGAAVLVDGGRIVEVGTGLSGTEVLELPGTMLSPGFVELHVHFLGGAGVLGVNGPDLDGLGTALVSRGVTSYLATSVTSPLSDLLALVEAAAKPTEGARCLGVHLEGPWISPARLGAQAAEWVANPSVADLELLLEAGTVRLLTVAPELPGAPELIRTAAAADVLVAMGHTDATYAEAVEGAASGVRHVTHCFNAMRGLHHREPGAVGAALDLPGLTVEAIADGVHLHPAMLRLIWRARGRGSMCLVSDAVDLPGLAGAEAARREDGTLAGSISALDHGVRTCIAAGIPLVDALLMATRTPADAIGRSDLGRIEPGAHADLVALDAGLRPVATLVGGVRQ